MVIKAGYNIQSEDVHKIIITTLQNAMNIIQEASDTSNIYYDEITADVFSDSTGKLNTIDTTNTTAEYEDESAGYINATFYDTFNDDSIGTIWTVNTDSYGSCSESNSIMVLEEAIDCQVTATGSSTVESNALPSLNDLNTLVFKVNKYLFGPPYGGLYGNSYTQELTIYFGEQIIETHSATNVNGIALNEDVEYTLVKNGSDYDVYKNGTYLKTITPTSNVLKFYVYVHSVYGGGGAVGYSRSKITCHYVFYNIENKVLQTNSQTFNNNINSILVTARTTTGSSSSITVDVSTDGGTTWEVTNQNLNEVIPLSGNGNQLVLRFNLSTTDYTDVPKIHAYAAQVWT